MLTAFLCFYRQFLSQYTSQNSVSASQHWAGLFGLVGQINQKVYEIATRESGVYVLDMAVWAASEGRGYSDATLDFMARQPLSAKGQLAFCVISGALSSPVNYPKAKGAGTRSG